MASLSPKLLLLMFLIVPLVNEVQSCSTPPGGCTLDHCKSLWGLKPPYQSKGGPTADPKIGWIYGVYNKNLPAGSTSTRAGGIVNWEVFPAVEMAFIVKDQNKVVVNTIGITDLATCCAMCAKTDGCRVYQFFDSLSWNKIQLMWDIPKAQYASVYPLNFWGDRQCYLLTGGTDVQETTFGSPYSGTATQQQATTGYPNRYYPPSWVGGACNGNASVVDDPHFVGAKGTRFEFNGDVGKTFTLITDERLHVNVNLGGYLDERTFGATKRENGKAVRTWIRKIGIIWKDEQGLRHTAVLAARTGSRMERAGGYLVSLEVDGQSLEVPADIDQSSRRGLFALTLLKISRRGPYDVEAFELSIKGLITIVLKLRVAHPLLQTEKEAYAHFNVHIRDLEATPKVHGVLGQTFRNTVTQTVKAIEYRLLGKLMGSPIVADGDSGKGFLDGEPSDYKTSGLLATDSKFTSF